MVIAVDFDGCIAEYDRILPEAVDALLFAQEKGHKLILWTCKSERYLGNVVENLLDRGIKFDAVNANVPNSEWFSFPKVFADIYLDDKSFPPFSGWAAFRTYLEGV
jgi:hypothetical protein